MTDKKGYPAPEYTQTPNLLLDKHMAELTPGAFKIAMAVVRQTFGWHKDKDRISLTQLSELTGLSRQGVINGINECMELGIIDREPLGQRYLYHLVVQKVDQSTELTSTSQQSRPALVNRVDTQKKEKEKKENSSGRKGWYAVYEDNIGLVPMMVLERLKDYEERVSEEWIEDAIQEAVLNNVRKPNYIYAILDNWIKDGRNQDKPQATPDLHDEHRRVIR